MKVTTALDVTKGKTKTAKITVHPAPSSRKGSAGRVWNFAKRHPVPVAAALAVGAAVLLLRSRKGKAKAKKAVGAAKKRAKSRSRA